MKLLKQKDFFGGPFGGGFTFNLYRIAFGLSLRWWSCLSAPAIELYIGPIKIWAYITLSKNRR